MLDVQVSIKRSLVIANLQKLGPGIEKGIQRGLIRSAKGVLRKAYVNLSGAGKNPGAYPVPVETGHLRRHLNWLKPGETKSGPDGSFTARKNESVIYDSAIYSEVIHSGLGSSSKFSDRPFLTDALEQFNQGEHIRHIIDDEIRKQIA